MAHFYTARWKKLKRWAWKYDSLSCNLPSHSNKPELQIGFTVSIKVVALQNGNPAVWRNAQAACFSDNDMLVKFSWNSFTCGHDQCNTTIHTCANTCRHLQQQTMCERVIGETFTVYESRATPSLWSNRSSNFVVLTADCDKTRKEIWFTLVSILWP